MNNSTYQRPRRSSSRGCFITVLALLVLAFVLSLLWLHSQSQSYNELSNTTSVGQVQVIKTKFPHLMLAVLITYSDGGQQESKFSIQVPGDEWRLEGDMITCAATDTCLLNFVGLHSSFKLTHWIGHFTSNSASDSIVDINGGDDNYFKLVHDHPTQVVSATKITSNFLQPNGKIYKLFVTSTGLMLQQAN